MRCGNCGRSIILVQPTDRSIYREAFWTHETDGGGDTDCRLSATPPRVVLDLSHEQAEALATMVEPSAPSDENYELYELILERLGR